MIFSKVVYFAERAAHSVNRVIVLFVLCLLVILVISQFGFESRTLVLIAPIPGPEVIKKNSRSTQLSLKFILLINVKMPTIVGILTFISRINDWLW